MRLTRSTPPTTLRSPKVWCRRYSVQEGRPRSTGWGDVHEQLCQTLCWLIDHEDVERVARVVRALRSLWEARHSEKGRWWVTKALAMPGAAVQTAARATLLDHAAILAFGAGVDRPTGQRRSRFRRGGP